VTLDSRPRQVDDPRQPGLIAAGGHAPLTGVWYRLQGLVDWERSDRARMRVDLAPELDLMARLGNPHLRFRSVHVTGTKGKGSVCALPLLGLERTQQNGPPDPQLSQPQPEADDPNMRMRAERDGDETGLNPTYLKWLNEAAARERQRNAAMLPGGDTVVPGTTWVNIGPNKANFLKNGNITLNKTDAGRVVAIVPDPTNADVLYVAMSGGGVWKTTDAITGAQPSWLPIT